MLHSQIKTSELNGAALDWAVAKCEGKLDVCGEVSCIGSQLWCYEDGEKVRYMPSDTWSQGGPIIEREGISVELDDGDGPHAWIANMGDPYQWGETPLIAAMRCYVASKLGDTVDIPEGLLK